MTTQPPAITFHTPEQISEVEAAPFMDIPATMAPSARMSASGLVIVVRYPQPYDDLQIFEGEVLSMAKWQRYQEAVVYFRSLEGQR